MEPNISSPSNISKAVSAAAGKNEKDLEFNLPWAVALAGAAFESYADVAVPGLVQKCPGGVEITYTNQEFLRDKLAGLVKLSIEDISLRSSLELENDDTQDDNGHDQEKRKEEKESSSFICKVSIGDGSLELQPQTFASNSDDKNFKNSSESTSSGYLFVRNLEKDRLSVRLINKKEESDAGVASLIVSEFVDALRRKKSSLEKRQINTKEKEIEISLDLQDIELNSVGCIRLKLEFKPFSDVFVASVASQAELNLLGSPGPALMTREWQDLTSQVFEASSAALEPVAFIENHDTDTQVWIFINKSLRQLVISFRGTVQDSWRDLLTDISMTPLSLETRHMKEAPRHASLAKLSEPGTIHKVMHTVAHAKKEAELRRQAAKRAFAENAAKFSQQGDVEKKEEGAAAAAAAIKSREEAEKETEGLVSNAVGAVKTTATDIQEFLARLKYLIDHGAIEGPSGPVPTTSGDGGNGGGGDSGNKGDIWVHSGVLTAYDSVRGAVLGFIDITLANAASISQEENTASRKNAPEESSNIINNNNNTDNSNEEPWTVLFTGHSLGGALATLAAFDLSHRSTCWKSNKPQKIAMYNFGSPRVGNKAFATEFNRVVPHAWRLVNRNDAVVTVPRLVGYCHVGHAVIVGLDPGTHNKKIEVQLHSSEAPFEGMAIVDEVLPAVGSAITHAVTHAVPAVMKGVGLDIAAAAAGAEGESEKKESLKEERNGKETQHGEEKKTPAMLTSEQLAEYWEQEKEAWSALFYGSAISEHMEEFYFKGIEDAVDEWRQQRAIASSHTQKHVSENDEHFKENEQQNSGGNNDVMLEKKKIKNVKVGIDE